MALDKLTLLDENIINTSATNIATSISTSVATTLINNSVQTNYISFPIATANPLTNGWRIYNDGASVAPVDGASGTTTITVTQNTSAPLNSTGDFRLTKTSGASRQGEGFSTDFTIANRHLGKVLQASFDYEVISGTLATDDIRFYIIQDPGETNTVIEPVGVSIQGSAAPTVGNPTIRLRHIATFQTHISVTSYRLCIHVATTTNSTQIVDFNNFRVWEPTQSIGAVITDWQSYTPTFSGMGTVTNINTQWRRVGGSIEVRGNFTTGTVPNAVHSFTLPSGFTTNVGWSSGNGILVGYISRNTSSESGTVGLLARNDNFIYISQYVGVASNNVLAINGANNYLSSTELQNFYLSVPIAGWGSSVAMSSDSGDGRVVACSYTNNTSNINPILFSVRDYDTHNAFNPTTGIFTAPISGYYRATASNIAAISVNGYLTINGENIIYSVSGNPVSGSRTLYRNAGQTISFEFSGGTLYSNGRMSIERISASSQVIASVETVACSVNKTSGTATTPNRIASWNTKDLDTHSGFDLTNGTFTVPSSGVYLINASAVNLGNFTSYNQPGFTIRNGTTILSVSTMYFTSSFEPELSTSALRRFIAGDIISLYGYGNGFGCNDLRMNISRIGI